MSMNELLPSVEELPRSDKLRLMEWLAAQLAKEEGVPLLSSEVEYPVRLPPGGLPGRFDAGGLSRSGESSSLMGRAARFSYTVRDPAFGQFSQMPDIPLQLSANGLSLAVSALLDTGASVNVLPYGVGLKLGLVWYTAESGL